MRAVEFEDTSYLKPSASVIDFVKDMIIFFKQVNEWNNNICTYEALCPLQTIYLGPYIFSKPP